MSGSSLESPLSLGSADSSLSSIHSSWSNPVTQSSQSAFAPRHPEWSKTPVQRLDAGSAHMKQLHTFALYRVVDGNIRIDVLRGRATHCSVDHPVHVPLTKWLLLKTIVLAYPGLTVPSPVPH